MAQATDPSPFRLHAGPGSALGRRALLGGLAALPFAARAAMASAPPVIVATTGMIADTARRLSGAEVTALMGPGIDPHSYRPTRGDILALSRADIILHHGLHLEAQFTGVLADLATKKTVVAVGEAVPEQDLLSDPEYTGRPDPHIWFDPALWRHAAAAIATALDGAGFDTAPGAAALSQDIDALDAYARTALATVPEPARILVTAHDAFAYFGRAHGWQVEGIQGISTESEAGLARISQLVDLLVTRAIPAVFVESSVSDRAMQALIEGAAAQGHSVAIGGELFSDAMGPEGSYEGTWPGMIDHNITTITRALGGTAPERGMAGKLGAAT
ncbi:MAG: manganese transporter [Rhodobacter sp. CACIA14H1]|nr:MAG: manganese transporter [Rhodobacter sp. CACIA14H1]